ncbi:MAG: ABC transporter permease subunit [Spirochaetaceae bacterium]|nr:MAG: ABC transporter permease subunit [Spirochaetaceae bacterium]
MIGNRRELKGCPSCARMIHLIVISVIVGSVLLPLVPLLVWSVSHSWFFPEFLPSELSGRAWFYIGSPLSKVLNALANSVLIAVLVTAAAAVLGIPAGRALGLRRFPGKEAVEYLILAPIIVPGLAVIMGIHVLFIKLGLVDTLVGVVLVHLLPSLPYMIMVMSGVFANYNVEFEQQAFSLGAGRARTFVHVTLPAILPGIVTGSLFVFLISWSQYILTVLIGGGRVITLPVLLFAFAAAGDNAVTAALCIVFLAPAVLILLITSRYLSGESGAMGGFGRL